MTDQKATELANADALPVVKNAFHNQGAKTRVARFNFTQSGEGAIGSTADLIHIPAGRHVLFFNESMLAWSAFGASRTIDIGYRAYTNIDGTAVAVSAAAFDNDIDVSSAGSAALGSDISGGQPKVFEVESKEGFTIFATVAGDVIDDGETLKGYITYASLN